MLFFIEVGLLVVCFIFIVNFFYNIYCNVYLFFLFLIFFAVYFLTSIYIIFFNAYLLHFVSLTTFFVCIVLYFYSHPLFGYKQKIPKGSLSLANSIKAVTDEYFYQKQFDIYGPIFKYSQYYKPCICIVGLPLGIELLKEYQKYLQSSSLPFSNVIPNGFLRYMEKENHNIYSPIFCKVFNRELVNKNNSYFKEQTKKQIKAIFASESNPQVILKQITFSCFSQLMLGIKDSHENFCKLETIVKSIPSNYMVSPQKTKTLYLLQQLYSLLDFQFLSQKDNHLNSVIDNLANMDLNNKNIKTIYGNLIFTFLISLSNATSLLYWVIKELTDNPQFLTEIKDMLVQDEVRALELSDHFVSEVLRLHQSEYIYRTVKESFYFRNYKFPKHWLVRICVRESHRDPNIFENPNIFNPKRFQEKKSKQSQFSPFGLDHHACFGAYLSRTLAKILICELAVKAPWKKISDGCNQKKLRHWNHWEPSSHFQIKWTNST